MSALGDVERAPVHGGLHALVLAALPQVPRDSEAIQRALDDVLARDEFTQSKVRTPSWLEKLWHEFVDWFQRTFDFDLAGAGPFVVKAFYVLMIVAVLYLGVRLVLAWIRSRRATPEAALESARAARVAELLASARAARANGDVVLALRLHFWALVIGLSERGDLEYRDAWTNRELVERGHPRPEVARILAALVPDLDAKSFGHAPASDADVEQLAQLCREHLGAAA
jgi:hypothetical protein